VRIPGSALCALAALALAIVVLTPRAASASDLVYDFSAANAIVPGPVFGSLTLDGSYVPGTDISAADFVSLQFNSDGLNFDLDTPTSISGGLNADGSLADGSDFSVSGQDFIFQEDPGGVGFAGSFPNNLVDMRSITFTPTFASEAPEPATWAMMLMGVLGAGGAMRLARRRALVTA
jgi:hypothetical protein